jgi:hypothetical protein
VSDEAFPFAAPPSVAADAPAAPPAPEPSPDRPPVTAGSLLTRTLQVWWRNVGKLAVMMLLLLVPLVILLIGLWRVFDPRPGQGGPLAPVFSLLLFCLILLPVFALIVGGISHGTVQWLAGQKAGVIGMLGQGGRRLWALLAAALLLFLAIAAGYLLLVVPGVMVAVATCATIPAVAVEGIGPAAALRRSLELTRGYRWSVFGAFFAMMALLFAANALVQGAMRAVPVLGALMSLPFSLLLTSIPHVLPAVAYHDLRVMKEGADTSRLAQVFE